MSLTAFIIDHDTARGARLAARLSAGYFEVNASTTLPESSRPLSGVVLIAADAPESLSICARVKARDGATPVVLYASDDEDAGLRLAGLEAGADDFIGPNSGCGVVEARLRNLLRLRAMTEELSRRADTARDLGLPEPDLADDPDAARPRVLIIGKPPEEAERLGAALSRRIDIEVETAANGFDAMRRVERGAPDAVIVAAGDGDQAARGFGEGDDPATLIGAISAAPEARRLPILLLSDDNARAAAALNAGASDCARPDAEAAELAIRLRAQIRRKRIADRLTAALDRGMSEAARDPVTGLHGRGYLERHLDRLFVDAKAAGRPLSVVMLDLDRFKQVNDVYGHPAGDAALAEFARRLRDEVRTADLVGRWGGEEFLIAMPGAGEAQALAAAERIRHAMADRLCDLGGGAATAVTVSAGVAARRSGDPDCHAILARADAALYEAKSLGRDLVMAASF